MPWNPAIKESRPVVSARAYSVPRKVCRRVPRVGPVLWCPVGAKSLALYAPWSPMEILNLARDRRGRKKTVQGLPCTLPTAAAAAARETSTAGSSVYLPCLVREM